MWGEWSEPLFIPLFPELYPNCGKYDCLTLVAVQCESGTIPVTFPFSPSFSASLFHVHTIPFASFLHSFPSSCPTTVGVRGVEERKSEDGSFPLYAIAIIAAVGLILLLLLVTVVVVVIYVNYRRRKLLLDSFKVLAVEVKLFHNALVYTPLHIPLLACIHSQHATW